MNAYYKALQNNQALLGVICILLATLGLSFKAIFIKLVYQVDTDIDAISILAIRMILAMPFFLLLLHYAGNKTARPAMQRKHVLQFFLLGALGFYLSALLDFSALAYIPAGLERLILFLYPSFVVLISLFIRPQEVGKHTFLALALSYSGIVVVLADQAGSLDAQMVQGTLMVLGAAIVFATYTVASVQPIRQHGSIRFTTFAMLAASSAILMHALLAHGWQVFQQSLQVYSLILPMALFSTVLPLILVAEGIKRIGASSSSIISTSGPAITIAVAYVLLGESFGLLQAVGGIMTMAGIFLVARKK